MNLYSCPYPSSITLRYPSTQYILTKGVNFDVIEPILDYFHEFTIHPILPKGIQIDPANGRIFGIPEALVASYSLFVIQAKDIVNQVHGTSIYLSVVDCLLPKQLMTIYFYVKRDGSNIGFDLYSLTNNGTDKLLSMTRQLPSYHTSSFGFCEDPGTFKLTIYDMYSSESKLFISRNGNGWEEGTYMTIILYPSLELLNERFISYGGISRDFQFSTNYIITTRMNVRNCKNQ